MVVAEKGEVIDIANIFSELELFFDEMVEAIQVDIGKELTGEIANG